MKYDAPNSPAKIPPPQPPTFISFCVCSGFSNSISTTDIMTDYIIAIMTTKTPRPTFIAFCSFYTALLPS
jgi:hypothetical protein